MKVGSDLVALRLLQVVTLRASCLEQVGALLRITWDLMLAFDYDGDHHDVRGVADGAAAVALEGFRLCPILFLVWESYSSEAITLMPSARHIRPPSASLELNKSKHTF